MVLIVELPRAHSLLDDQVLFRIRAGFFVEAYDEILLMKMSE